MAICYILDLTLVKLSIQWECKHPLPYYSLMLQKQYDCAHFKNGIKRIKYNLNELKVDLV